MRLMVKLIEIARQLGLANWSATRLARIQPMLRTCRELGFAIKADPNDAALIRVRKKLI